MGKGTRDAPRDALISFSAEKKDVGRAFGFHRGADTLGAALGPLLAFVILPVINNDLRTLFLLSFVASLIAVVILWASVKEVYPVRSQSRRDVGAADAAQPHRTSNGVKNHEDDVVLPKFEFRNLGLPFIIFLIAATIFSLGRASEAFLLLRAQNVGVILALLPIIYFVYNITFAVLATPAGILSDRIGHRNTFMLGMLIFSGTYFLFSQVSSLWGIWVLFAVYGFYSALTEGVGKAIVADLIEPHLRATAYGMYNAFTGFALLPASLVFGILWDRFGPAASFRYGAFLGIIAFVVFAFLRIKNHQKTGF